MVSTCSINIGDFKVVTNVDATPASMVNIESFEKRSYEIYESDKSIQEGLKWKVRGREMSSIVLLTKPGITSERGYIRSTASDTVQMAVDKKYDNLRRYIENLRRFYKSYGDKLAAIKTTMDVQDLATLFSEIAKAGAGAKQDHNERVAGNALSTMNLDMSSGSKVEIDYSTVELNGKFVLVNDGTNASIKDDNWDPIQFSSGQLQKIASRPNTSIVLLLMKCSEGYVLCRKDIAPSEVDIVLRDGVRKINSESYMRLKPQIDSLLRGGTATYSGAALKLHISAKLERL